MPRGHKSKRRHAPKKRQQARTDNMVCKNAQEEVLSPSEVEAAEKEVEQGAAAAAIEEEEEIEECSFSHLIPGIAYRIPPLPCRSRSPSISGLSAEGSFANSDKTCDCEHEDCESGASYSTECLSESFQCPVDALEWFILQKFRLRRLFTLEEMVNTLDWRHRKHFPGIFKAACEHLEAIFAVEMREVESNSHTYNLFSKLKLPNNGRIRPGRGYPKTGLLLKILAVIFVKNHCAAEEDIWKFLKKIHVYPGKLHYIFGNTKKLLTQDFVKLKYLEYRQVPGSDPPSYEFLWGPQAHAETNKEKILKYLIGFSTISPAYFSCLYQEAMKMEIERMQAILAACSISISPSVIVQATCLALPPKP
ncbi:melanoma-associated antigen B5-like [Octodon degus]|uniref:Melanoma-associated antigen B5-like n=1 Tax=Octodon degus TaxID=10160 RepID=A0A6P3ETQ3_OCTDE|nr:melanoma-associated antigen B5-like [Octodon degus]